MKGKSRIVLFLQPTWQKLVTFLSLIAVNILCWYLVFRPTLSAGIGGHSLSIIDGLLVAVALISGLFTGVFILYPVFTPALVLLFIVSLFWTHVFASILQSRTFKILIGWQRR